MFGLGGAAEPAGPTCRRVQSAEIGQEPSFTGLSWKHKEQHDSQKLFAY